MVLLVVQRMDARRTGEQSIGGGYWFSVYDVKASSDFFFTFSTITVREAEMYVC